LLCPTLNFLIHPSNACLVSSRFFTMVVVIFALCPPSFKSCSPRRASKGCLLEQHPMGQIPSLSCFGNQFFWASFHWRMSGHHLQEQQPHSPTWCIWETSSNVEFFVLGGVDWVSLSNPNLV
jgi:hypothetical protein